MIDLERTLAPHEAARLAGVTPQCILFWCRTGRLRFTWSPLGRLVDRDDLERVIAERAGKSTAA